MIAKQSFYGILGLILCIGTVIPFYKTEETPVSTILFASASEARREAVRQAFNRLKRSCGFAHNAAHARQRLDETPAIEVATIEMMPQLEMIGARLRASGRSAVIDGALAFTILLIDDRLPAHETVTIDECDPYAETIKIATYASLINVGVGICLTQEPSAEQLRALQGPQKWDVFKTVSNNPAVWLSLVTKLPQ